jgi:hypothetical protein
VFLGVIAQPYLDHGAVEIDEQLERGFAGHGGC